MILWSTSPALPCATSLVPRTLEKVLLGVPGPNTNTAVFVSVRDDCRGVEIPDDCGQGRDDTVDLLKGSQHLLKYNAVANFVDDGSLQLI